MAGISHQSLPDFFLRLSSLCPSWLPVGSVSQAGLLRFVLFCLFFLTSQCWKLQQPPTATVLLQAAGRMHIRRREGVRMCSWSDRGPSWVKVKCLSVQDCDSCPSLQGKLNLSALPELKATPSYCSTRALGSVCLTRFSVLGVSLHFHSTHASTPGMFHSSPRPSKSLGGKVKIKHTVYFVEV